MYVYSFIYSYNLFEFSSNIVLIFVRILRFHSFKIVKLLYIIRYYY